MKLTKLKNHKLTIQVNRHLFHTKRTTQSEILTVLKAQQDPHWPCKQTRQFYIHWL